MVSLATFRFVGRHALNLLSGVYIAAVLAQLIGKLMPSAQIWTFLFLCLLWILTGVAVIIRELHHGQQSLAELGVGALPPVIVGSAVVLLIARLIAHYEPALGFSIIFAEWGLFFWVGGYLLLMRDAYHKKKLDEDLAKKLPESSNQTLEPTADRSGERSAHSPILPDTLSPPSRWTLLQNIAKALLVIVVLILFSILVFAFHG